MNESQQNKIFQIQLYNVAIPQNGEESLELLSKITTSEMLQILQSQSL